MRCILFNEQVNLVELLKWNTLLILHWNCLVKRNMLRYVHQWFDTQSEL